MLFFDELFSIQIDQFRVASNNSSFLQNVGATFRDPLQFFFMLVCSRAMMHQVRASARGFATRPSKPIVLSSLSKTPPRRRISAGIVSPPRSVPLHISRPPYIVSGKVPEPPRRAEIKTPEQIEALKRTCSFAAEVLDYASKLVAPGVTTDFIDYKVHEYIIANQGYPSPLGYKGFPKSICTSVNEVLCHGIPDSRPLVDGDIVNIDVTVYRDGVHGDTSATFGVGSGVSADAQKLMSVCRESLEAAIRACGPGVPFSAIGQTIDKIVARRFDIARIYAGHGIGAHFHEPPYIFHFSNRYGAHVVGATEMLPGMVFTIEPILAAGSCAEKTWSDGWTSVTQDASLAAQFEHTILITDSGASILTQQPPAVSSLPVPIPEPVPSS